MSPAETVSRWAMFLDKPIEVEDAIAALVKAERERAEPWPDADGWIEWGGRECPVPKETPVYIRYGDGTWDEAREGPPDEAGWFDSLGWWDSEHPTGTVRIIAYRILPSQVTK